MRVYSHSRGGTTYSNRHHKKFILIAYFDFKMMFWGSCRYSMQLYHCYCVVLLAFAVSCELPQLLEQLLRQTTGVHQVHWIMILKMQHHDHHQQKHSAEYDQDTQLYVLRPEKMGHTQMEHIHSSMMPDPNGTEFTVEVPSTKGMPHQNLKSIP